MSERACPRSFEVEAMRDGRLGAAECASFLRHVHGCAACAHEIDVLDELANAVRSSSARGLGTEGAAHDELEARRERTRLLAAFDRALVTPPRRALRRSLLFAPALVVAALLLVQLRARPESGPGAQSVIRAAAATRWSKRIDNGRETITLEAGTLWVRVDHARGSGRIRLVLPDGELEDTGTVFRVSAASGRTTRVAVDEGSVVLRLRGHAPVVIAAGRGWSADAATSPEPPSGATHTERTVAAETPARRELATHLKEQITRPRPPPPDTQARAPDSAAAFRAATALLSEGNHRDAASAFARFVDSFPRDARTEDAAYLRVIALQRCRDEPAMRDAAREYLRRYPSGFRRDEIERVLTDSK